MSPAQERRVLAALLFGNFVTGTGILLPAGMLGELAHGFDVSIPSAGLLLLVSGVVVALGAPLAAAVTSAGQRDALGPWYICRKFRSAGPACGHCS